MPDLNSEATFDIRAYLPNLAIGQWYDLYFISDSFADDDTSNANSEQSLSAWYLPDSIRIKTDALSGDSSRLIMLILIFILKSVFGRRAFWQITYQ